jgi:hypothetical protein
MKVYRIATDDDGFKDFFSLADPFIQSKMTKDHLNDLSYNAIFNADNILRADHTHVVELAALHGSGVSAKLTEIFDVDQSSMMSVNEVANAIVDTSSNQLYDRHSISFDDTDFTLDTINRLKAFCSYVDQSAKDINHGVKLASEDLQKFIAEKIGLSWVNFYNVAQDQIARSIPLPNNSDGEQGDALAAEGKYNSAAEKYKSATYLVHNNPTLMRSLQLRQCDALLHAGRYKESTEVAHEIVNTLEEEQTRHKLGKQETLDLAHAHYLRGRAYKSWGTSEWSTWLNDTQMLSNAGSDLKKARELDPENHWQ